MPPSTESSPRWKDPLLWAYILFLVFAVVLRVAYLSEYASSFPTYERPLVDARIYEQWAARIVQGDIWSRSEGVFYRAPFYPYFLAALWSVFGALQPVTIVVQAILGVATMLLVARLAARWGGPGAGLGALALLALYGPLYTAESKLLATTLALFLQVLVLILALRVADRPTWPRSLLLGATLGLAVLVRPLWLLWVPLLPLVLLGRPQIQALRVVWIPFLLGVAVMIAPVTLRNFVVGGDLVLIASNGGMTFFQGNNVENRSGLLTIISRFEMFGSAERQQEVETRVASELAGHSLTPRETSRFWFRQGLEFITDSPRAWLALEAKKLFRLVSSFEPGDNYSHALERDRIRGLTFAFLPFGVLLALALLGTSRKLSFTPAARLAALSAATGLCGCLVFFVSSRYRMEAVPGLAILGGAALAGGVRWLRDFRDVSRGGWVFVLSMVSAGLVLAVTWLPPGTPAQSAESISLLQMGNAWERQGDRERARTAYEQSIESLPENAFSWRSLLQLTVQDSGAAVALQRLDSAPESARSHPEVRQLRGRFLAALGRPDEAIPEFEQATKDSPELREAWFYLGSALRDVGRYRDAIGAYEMSRQKGWPEVDVLPVLSFLKVQTGDLIGAEEDARAALAIDGSLSSAQLNLIVADVYLGNLGEAERLLSERDSNDPLTRYYRGLVALRRGEWSEAEQHLSHATRLDPGNRRAAYYRSLALVALGRAPEGWPESAVDDEEPAARGTESSRTIPGDTQVLARRWLQVRCKNPWSGIPERGAELDLWDELRAASAPVLDEIVRYVGEEEAGLHPAGNP
ncbi:MAG: tetratricopeptide repeat protein [Candidatus Eisenbacteria bacterium]|uniref:Tetratricopeptide repeat protein n=1 Tax=Eiseniibacteriota bacterium TaxID=2212470 RepID=A0A956N8U1_UNCEI|nr:tetratricopeptide repeat protein [Candidatus Eisenbacteria bacterium]